MKSNPISFMKNSILLARAERHVTRQIIRNINRGHSEAKITVEPLAAIHIPDTKHIAFEKLLKKKYKELKIESEPHYTWVKNGGFKAWLKQPTQLFRLTAPQYVVPILNISWE